MVKGYTVVMKRTLYQVQSVQVDATDQEDAIEQAYAIVDARPREWTDIDEEVELDDVDVGPPFGDD